MAQTISYEVLQHVVFRDWLNSLRDTKAKARIAMRIAYLSQGNAGDFKAIGDSVMEMRIHYGPGYRVYYKQTGRTVIILLCGGDETTQVRDMARAKELAATV